MTKKNVILAAALAIGAYALSSSNTETAAGTATDSCTTYYRVGTDKVCEIHLPLHGYVWWNGTDGEGWYHYTQFANNFALNPPTHFDSIEALAESASSHTAAGNPADFQQVLTAAYKGGGILQAV